MTATPETLSASLLRELALVNEFIEALRAEARALEQPDDHQLLHTSTERKNACADTLGACSREREAIQAQLGLPAGRAGLDAAANVHPGVAEIWPDLLEAVQLAREINTANGALIDTYIQHNQQALDLLRQLTGMGNLYDASGRRTAAGLKRGKDITAA